MQVQSVLKKTSEFDFFFKRKSKQLANVLQYFGYYTGFKAFNF